MENWTPKPEDAINLATIRWYAITLEKLLLEIYATNRQKLPRLQAMLNEQIEAIYAYSQATDLNDNDACPLGQVMCRDGLCHPRCFDWTAGTFASSD